MYVYPIITHFYIAKLGHAEVYLLFLILLQNIDCEYLLEPPQQGGSSLSENIKNINIFLLKISIFTPERNPYVAWACNAMNLILCKSVSNKDNLTVLDFKLNF